MEANAPANGKVLIERVRLISGDGGRVCGLGLAACIHLHKVRHHLATGAAKSTIIAQ